MIDTSPEGTLSLFSLLQKLSSRFQSFKYLVHINFYDVKLKQYDKMCITIGEKEDLWNMAYVKLCRPLPELAQHSHPTEHLQIPCGIIHQL